VSPEELTESLDRHFLAGCLNLSVSQLHEHQATGVCPECRDRAWWTALQADLRRPLAWLNSVYHHPAKPPSNQRDVLTALAVKFVDLDSGEGHASIEELADFCDASRSTVQRALRWARKESLAVRLSRGHRLGNGESVASAWQLW